MYELYVTNKNYSSWSLRSWLLLVELGIPFHETFLPLPDHAAGEGFVQVSPNGRVPCLVDGGNVVWESIAIAEYLAERHPGVWPTDAAARAWARCAAAEMHAGFSTLRSECAMSCGQRVELTAISAPLARDLARIGALWAAGLTRFGGPFLAGETFTAVDAFFAPVAFRILTYALPLDAACLAYAARLRELAGMRRWYADALAETLREPDHEAEIARAGRIVEDLRAVAAGAA